VLTYHGYTHHRVNERFYGLITTNNRQGILACQLPVGFALEMKSNIKCVREILGGSFCAFARGWHGE
jgi:hypothetical protein